MTEKQQLAFEKSEKAKLEAQQKADRLAKMSFIERIKEMLKGMNDLKATIEMIRGVMNLRGAIVPIIDLRSRFAMPAIEYTATTVVIVLKVHNEGAERTIGFVVDAVSDVYNVSAEQFRAAPDFGAHMHTDFIRALATVDEKMVILLDIDRLVSAEELEVPAAVH